MKVRLPARVALFATLTCMAGYAVAGESGEKKKDFQSVWYLGVGGGSTQLEPEGESAGFSAPGNSSSSIQFSFGQKFKPRWGWEVSYLDAGSAELINPNPALQAAVPDAAIDYTVAAGFANYYFKDDSARFNYFAKLGVSQVNAKSSDSRIVVNEDSTTQAAFALGAEMRFAENWFLRLEYDGYSKDAGYTGLSLGYRFGGSTAATSGRKRVPLSERPLPVVIEYPLYIPEEQITVLAEDRDTVTAVADEITRLSEELVVASKLQQSEHLARQADVLVKAGKRIAIVEESILRTTGVDPSTIDPNTFINAEGEKLLVTPAEQSAELGNARRDIGNVQKAVGDMPFVRERLERVQGRLAVVEESLLFIPPWEEAEAQALCQDFETKEERVQFRSESIRLTADAERVLNEIADKMNRNRRVIMEIHAYTDSWGTFAYNQQLSEQRAQRTVDYLIERGVARARLVAQGHGEFNPIEKNTTDAGRALNRRVELVIKNPNICQAAAE